ncbi:hypothetical protein GSH04_17570 [Burkholderia pseudomallei]|nr:hypothetical protein [Burkholderia pseudomallei]MBM5630588.1 hypothetical protein [Burkholderia pseudomallei]MBM5660008.1 hypothetical protein [Burkholderia pseudomallei]
MPGLRDDRAAWAAGGEAVGRFGFASPASRRCRLACVYFRVLLRSPIRNMGDACVQPAYCLRIDGRACKAVRCAAAFARAAAVIRVALPGASSSDAFACATPDGNRSALVRAEIDGVGTRAGSYR